MTVDVVQLCPTSLLLLRDLWLQYGDVCVSLEIEEACRASVEMISPRLPTHKKQSKTVSNDIELTPRCEFMI